MVPAQPDNGAKPDWVEDPETGDLLIIERDSEYAQTIITFNQGECSHPETEPTRVRIANGAIQVRQCCTVCGARVGTSMPQKDKGWVDSLPWQSVELSNTYKERRRAELQGILLDLARKQQQRNGRFTASYRAYLKSAEWRDRCQKVMKRCGGVCEGCGDRPAVHVHHQTYRHFGNEFLFELLGLCRECHERYHADDEDQSEAA